MEFDENLTNMTSSTAFLVHHPDRERGKGQRHSDVTRSLLLSVPCKFVTSLSDVSELFDIGFLDNGAFLLCASNCQN